MLTLSKPSLAILGLLLMLLGAAAAASAPPAETAAGASPAPTLSERERIALVIQRTVEYGQLVEDSIKDPRRVVALTDMVQTTIIRQLEQLLPTVASRLTGSHERQQIRRLARTLIPSVLGLTPTRNSVQLSLTILIHTTTTSN